MVLPMYYTSHRNDASLPPAQCHWVSLIPCILRHTVVTRAHPILNRILGGHDVDPLAYQEVVCTKCNFHDANAPLPLSLLGGSVSIKRICRLHGRYPYPVELVVSRFIETYRSEPFMPSHSWGLGSCEGKWILHSFRIPQTSWTWFRLNCTEQNLTPSLMIKLDPSTDEWTHALHAILYIDRHGSGHVTARIYKEGNLWWCYDSQWEHGKPRLEAIRDETELRQFNERIMEFIIYRRCNVDD
jgi:hypothetical protein